MGAVLGNSALRCLPHSIKDIVQQGCKWNPLAAYFRELERAEPGRGGSDCRGRRVDRATGVVPRYEGKSLIFGVTDKNQGFPG